MKNYGRNTAVLFSVMKDFAKRFYKSKAWQRTRAVAWARDKGLCVDCMKRGLITPAEEVHHIKELTTDNIDDPRVTLNLDNLVSLCRECHQARHNTNASRYKILPNGQVVAKNF